MHWRGNYVYLDILHKNIKAESYNISLLFSTYSPIELME